MQEMEFELFQEWTVQNNQSSQSATHVHFGEELALTNPTWEGAENKGWLEFVE